MRRRRSYSSQMVRVCLVAFLASCSAPTPPPTATLVPPIDTFIPEIPTLEATATPVPPPTRPQYTMNVVLDYSTKSVAVDQTIVYPNHSGQFLTDLVLAVEPNLWSGCFSMLSLTLDGVPPSSYTLDGQRLSISLPAAMQPETSTTIQMQYSLTLPLIEPTNPNLSRPRIFGYSPRQVNLTNWYPFVVPRINSDWVLHDPWYYGEHLVYEASDITVNLKFADPATAPVVAASAAPTPNGEWNTYSLTSGRTFAISASNEFLTASMQAGDATVTTYYLQPVYKGAAEAALNAAAQALQIYSKLYGPYPHPTLAVVMGDFNDGMEFSAFFYLSRDFYNLYDGTTMSYLVFVAAHETAHQWWFEQVASDQAMQPWLDEALSTYSEHLFYEASDPKLVSWWWIYRVDFYSPQGWVDIPVYAGEGFRRYTNAVYFRGAHFMDELRKLVGDDVFFGFLRDYLQQENNKIATAADFFRILAQHTQIDVTGLQRQYFQNSY